MRSSLVAAESVIPTEQAVSQPENDPRVIAALEEYLDALRSSQPPSREAFLGRHADIAGILGECLAGLEFVQSASALLAQSGDVATSEEGLPPSTRLGDYEIVREIGRGGMGVVYEAEQVSLSRRVALKVLPFAAALDPRQRQRFQIEAQAASHLQHPHIVPVFVAGSDHGVHFYAMQYIDGRSLDDVIKGLRGKNAGNIRNAGTSSRGRDDIRAVARLGLQAAEGLEHAHSLGVLHRDIKPANLMLDERDNLWITDFGLARFQDDSGLTCTGQPVGTLRYMSPEQARGRGVVVDHRTDIYSLGATLYELLTLRPAFDGKDPQTLYQQIIADDPPAPRRLERSIPLDLETIVLKAMAKEPQGRYATAHALVQDLQRFLNDEPIHARRPSGFALLAKWARRHRPALATAAVIMTIAILAGGVLLWLEERKTAAALFETRQARDRERATLLATFTLSDELAMQGMARFADTASLGGVNDYYVKAREFYSKITVQTHLDAKIRAMAFHRLAFTRMILRDPRAEAAYRTSVSLFESLLDQSPSDVTLRMELANVLLDHGTYLQATQGIKAAEPAFRRALKLDRQLAAAHPDKPEHRLRLGGDLSRVYGTLIRSNRRDEAERLVRECIDSIPKSHGLCNNLAWYFVTAMPPIDLQHAVALAKEAIDGAAKEESKVDGAYWNTLGVAQYLAGDADAARAALEKSMSLRDGGDPYDWFFMARLDFQRGDPAAAQAWYDKSVEWMRSHRPTDPYLSQIRKETATLMKLSADERAGAMLDAFNGRYQAGAQPFGEHSGSYES